MCEAVEVMTDCVMMEMRHKCKCGSGLEFGVVFVLRELVQV